ncbi:MAG TPA: hypothetical protein VFY89_03415, partial [Ktedonobacterales bacterium]
MRQVRTIRINQRAQAMKAHGHWRRVIPRVALAILAAAAITALLLKVFGVYGVFSPRYSVNPLSVLLTSGDVGSRYTLMGTGAVAPAQQTGNPLPYQQQYIGGLARLYIANSVLSTAGQQEIDSWEQQYGFNPTTPPTIMGPFVADHGGIFSINNVERSFQTTDAAWHEYHCCHYVGRDQSFDDYHSFEVQGLGDEANGWTGIRKAVTGQGITMPQSDAFQ